MSAFDETQVNPTEETTQEEVSSYLEKLVADRGEQWKDPEVIAKGKIEADQFIESLKRQNEELRKELDKGEKMDEILEMLKGQNKAPEQAGGREEPAPRESNTQTNPDDLKALVESFVSEREARSMREQNIQSVDSELIKRFGNNAASVVARQSSELGMTVDEAKELAATKPKAFFRLMGIDGQNQSASPTMRGSTVSSESRPSGGPVRDWNYYQDLRRKNKTQFYSPRIQKQMEQDMRELGDRFGLPRS